MKKTKKSHTLQQPAVQAGKGIPGQEPPSTVADELVSLFSSGKVELIEQKGRETIGKWPASPLGWKALGTLLLMQERCEEAAAALSAAVERSSSDPQIHFNLGTARLKLNRFAEAESSFRQAIRLKPDYLQAHINLGITLFELGEMESAVTSYRQALSIRPDAAETHNNLGNALKELGRLQEAESSYRQALTFRPHAADTLCNLGLVLQGQKRQEEAVEAYRQATAISPGTATAHLGLAESLLTLNRGDEACVEFQKTLSLSPLCIEAHIGLNNVRSRMVPLWHLPMMNDAIRNDAYYKALQNAITPDTHVLEIGTGSGLLSMMAARFGARKVTTCEAVSTIAETARAIVADNGFSSTVTVHAKMSTNLAVGVELDERADLLVSEVLSSEFLSEGVLPSIEDAKKRLLKPGARIIPARGSIRFALFGGSDIGMNVRVDQVYGFDLSRFNTIVAQKQFITRNDLDIELLSDDITAFSFDFENTDHFPAEEQVAMDVTVQRAGRCCGIIQWIHLEMDDTVVFENHPSEKNPASSWQHCAFLFGKPVDVHPGQVVSVIAAHNRDNPWFIFKELR